MSNSIPVTTKTGPSENVRAALSNNQTLHMGLSGLAMPPDTGTTTHHPASLNSTNSIASHGGIKNTSGGTSNPSVGGPSLADILGATETPPHASSSNSSHPTVGSHATPLSNDRASCTATTHNSSTTRHTGNGNGNGNGTGSGNGTGNGADSHSPAHFGVLSHISGGPELASGATNSTTTSVQICQRMDEVSARMIAMEEMFNKLCCKISDQEMTIQHLRQQSEQFLSCILTEIRQVNHSIPVLDNPDDNEKDGFVTDLLNSITNVSSNYLKKVNSKHTQKYKRQRSSLSEPEGNQPKQTNPPSSAHNSVNVGDKNPTQAIPNLQQQPPAAAAATADGRPPVPIAQDTNSTNMALPHYLTQRSFTLNPNGIKRRRANTTATNNTPIAAQINQDFAASSNGLGSMSLPNITLENMARKYGSNSNTGSYPSILDNVSTSSKPRSRAIDIQVGSESASSSDSSDEEDGYQEEDEDHNSDAFGPQFSLRQHQRGGSNRAQEMGFEASYADFFGSSGHSLSRSSSHKTQRDAVAVANTHAHITRDSSGKGSRRGNSSSQERDLNYTLLKAPANVRAIWQEYIEGIDGNPSVKFLEDVYGNRWRLKKNVKTFARRKRLYKFILNGLKRGHTADEMIDVLEKRRIYKNEHGEVKKRTIGWLQQSLSGI
ncbi:LAME_0B04874g1_1 [Lachancea meyersii CBS 8951]|uniref:LAME_0B04874g1_1 n=1 Tax=Lachancea meyersii CBS 8951 TaxID=1266667 RepID=A0A1G4IVH9_9SACH|nr:LAME_0B04874g1_1 [Lachancea meyersii CBS 8951]